MASGIARDSAAAWAALRQAGGIELQDRDAEFPEQLRIVLHPSAATLDEALAKTGIDDFVRAFFGLIEPYVQMFRDILDFFEAAGASEGREQWSLKIEDEHLDLKHFQKFIETWDALDCQLDVPAIDSKGAWAAYRARSGLPGMEQPLGFLRGAPGTGSIEADRWLTAYARGEYPPLPRSLDPTRVPRELRDAAAIVTASVEIIRRLWRDRETMLAQWRSSGGGQDYGDGFSPRTIAIHETDFRLGSFVFYLATYPSLDSDARQQFSERLAEELGKYPRRKIGISAQLPDLERILSLPLWRRRYELYAVWIATEIVSALPGHDCEIHHENGSITFSFRETVVATIHSTRPLVKLYAERRSPLDAPIGAGRKGNVQPDYSFWRGSEGQDTCGLVIEVKHYKHDAPARFREVLTDYARAHRSANVILVSHGPTGESVYDLDADIRGRCDMLGELTSNHVERRNEFRKWVRDSVGAPVASRRSAGSSDRIIAVDISESMSRVLDTGELIGLLESYANGPEQPVALMDTQIHEICRVDELRAALSRTPRGSTHLRPLVDSLLNDYASLVMVTDAEGAAELSGLNILRKISEVIGGRTVEIVEIQG